MLVLIGVIYYFSAASYLFVGAIQEAFPAGLLKQHSAFGLYKHEGGVFKNAFYLYMPNNLYTYVMNSIFSTEIIETLPFLKARIENEHGHISRPRLVGLRIVVWLVSVLLSLATRDIVTVLNISGSLFTPVVSYFGPVASAH